MNWIQFLLSDQFWTIIATYSNGNLSCLSTHFVNWRREPHNKEVESFNAFSLHPWTNPQGLFHFLMGNWRWAVGYWVITNVGEFMLSFYWMNSKQLSFLEWKAKWKLLNFPWMKIGRNSRNECVKMTSYFLVAIVFCNSSSPLLLRIHSIKEMADPSLALCQCGHTVSPVICSSTSLLVVFVRILIFVLARLSSLLPSFLLLFLPPFLYHF